MKQLDPKSVWLFFFQILPATIAFTVFFGFFLFPLFGLFIFPIAFLGGDEPNFLRLIIVVLFGSIFYLAVISILSYIWAKLSYKYYRYELTDLGFKKEHGVIWKKYVTIPYDRIQNVDIFRGLLARILGLSDLHIQTAGFSGLSTRRGMYGGSEGRLPGLSIEDAEKLRDELIQKATRTRGQGV